MRDRNTEPGNRQFLGEGHKIAQMRRLHEEWQVNGVDAARLIDRTALPSNGTVLAEITQGQEGGEEYDRAYPERLKATIY